MSEDIRTRNRKRWIIFSVALLVPVLLVLLLFVAASQDAKTTKRYASERAGYAEKFAQQDEDHALASDPEATTSSNQGH
ncbi:hypothetical protein [Acinetobacter nectaris]|uniref:hypothetical protein n=1 Tax=Acinetobacter nectaris TaxID=1219382 RepID=UPI001F46D197|nr:hypothetical protein [Acinetobacter nectaris]MCF9046212.1 hypothetical protein [Acinetobacter nectaris]